MSARPSPLRWLAALLVLVCGLLLAPTAFAAPARDQLRLGLPLEPPNLDPTTGAAAAVDEVLYANVMEGLVRIDADGQIQPALATNWEVSPDGLVYVFHLRSGVRFHNGAQFDASIVKFTLDRARASDSANVQKDALGVIRSVEVIDPQTVKLTLTRASNRLLYVLAWGDCVMVEPNSVKDIAAHPVGTGPFRFGEWRRGDSVTLVRNDAYWGKPAQVRGVVFKFIADPTAAFAAMKAGDLDAFPDFPAPENLAEFKKDPRFRVVVGLTQGETILGINNRSKPLSDVRVRRAIAYAIDRQAIIKAGLFGYGAPIGSHFAPQAQGYVDLTGAYPYNPAKARALLAEAGYPNGFELSLKLPPPFYARRGGEIIASQLAQVGIRVKSENLEWAQWLDQVLKNHNFDLTIVSHTEPMDYDIYGRPDYYFGYQNPEFNRLLAAQDAATDPRQQLELLAAIQRKLSDDAVNAWLFQFPRLGVWRADVRGLWPNSPIQADNVTGAYFEGAQTGGALAAVSRAGSSRAAGWIALGLGLIVLLLAGRKVGARYLAARSGYLIATLIGATRVVFALTLVVPGDPASFLMGLNANPQAVAALRHQLGVDQPIPAQYFHWVSRLLHGDFGTSYTYRVPVAGLIAERLAVSGPLALYAMLLSVLVGVPIGVLAAARRNSAADTGLMALS
ncbi:MAG: ABC transporter substrate-binding protein [Caulobacteraceae bacterium]